MADTPVLSLAQLLSETGGALLGRAVSDFPRDFGVAAATLDSRTVPPASLFVPLSGGRFDGHDYIPQALASGARISFVSAERAENDGSALRRLADESGAALVVVDGVLAAFQKAAAAYLSLFPHLTRVGITGSAGKTTVKELAGAMLSVERQTYINPGNLNSDEGLPVAAFGVRSHHEVAIFEMGTNRRGEMAELASIVHPNLALVTNIGTAHIGMFGSREGIAEEKKAIFSRFDSNGLALVPEDDDFASFLTQDIAGISKTWGPRSQGNFGGAVSLGLDGSELVWAGERVHLSLPGPFNVRNALAAASIAEHLGVSASAVKGGIESARPLFGRGEILKGRVTVLRDCYNANPESVEGAIDFCDSVQWRGRKVYVIGEMKELGERTEGAHRALGRRLASSCADLVCLFGEAAEDTLIELGSDKPAIWGTDISEFGDSIADALEDGDLVLLKGSRGTALERLSDRLVPGAGGH